MIKLKNTSKKNCKKYLDHFMANIRNSGVADNRVEHLSALDKA